MGLAHVCQMFLPWGQQEWQISHSGASSVGLIPTRCLASPGNLNIDRCIIRTLKHIYFLNDQGRRAYSWTTKSFLYSLYNINGYQPIKLTLTGNDSTHAILGTSHAMVLYLGMNMTWKSLTLHQVTIIQYTTPKTYHPPPGCSYRVLCSHFAGTSPFTPSDVEVFYETTN